MKNKKNEKKDFEKTNKLLTVVIKKQKGEVTNCQYQE